MVEKTISKSKSCHISVCICTFHRAEMLARAIERVASQAMDRAFSLEVVVVDNDKKRSAEDTVRQFEQKSTLKIKYDCEPIQNIALARNRAVRHSTGDLIAFIDDDEFPIGDWIMNMYRCLLKYEADGVLGPVVPDFPEGAPEWLKKGNIFDRRRLPTGMILGLRDSRTGNVLLKRELFNEDSMWFDPTFGRTGGEDVDFFGRQLAKGRIFVWCDEAEAYETIPPERWDINFHFKKYLRIGTINGERLRQKRLAGLMDLMKTIVSLPVWFIVLMLLFPFGKHLWIRPALKLAYSGSCILAYCGYSILRYRE